jgi:hypothetical protein
MENEWYAIISVPVFEDHELHLDNLHTFLKKILDVIPIMGLMAINASTMIPDEGKLYNEVKLLYRMNGYNMHAFETHIMLQIAQVVEKLEDVKFELTKDENAPLRFHKFNLN